MRYRKWDANGDMVFGHNSNDFLVNTPQTVAQAVVSRLRLQQFNNVGEWFIDTSDGTPWDTEVLGTGTAGTRDLTIQDRVLGTPNVSGITAYSSSLNPIARVFSVVMTLNTAYGQTVQTATFSTTPGGS
jgi:hypothetical protein